MERASARSRPHPARAPVDLRVDDERTTNAAAHRDVNDRGITAAGTEPAFGQTSGIGVILNRTARNVQALADPINKREILPTIDLVRFLDSPASSINGTAKANPDGL